MIQLSTIPAFGWETASCNANRAYVLNASDEISAAASAIARNETIPRITGQNWRIMGVSFETTRQKVVSELTQKALMRSHWWRNGKKIVGYSPLFGTLSGLYYFKQTWNTPAEKLPHKAAHLFRHAIEISSCACLLLPLPDLYVTLQRSGCFKRGWV